MESIRELLAQAGSWLVVLSVGTFLLALLALPWLLVKLPEDYLVSPPESGQRSHPLRALALNLLGGLLVIAGVLMLVLPGQGLLTLVAGLMIMDFPGKHRLLVKLLSREGVLKGVNMLRGKVGAPPIRPRMGSAHAER